MRTMMLFLLSMSLCVPLFAMGGTGGSKPGTCSHKAWSCVVPMSECFDYEKKEYNQECSANYVTKCMGNCDASKHFPQYFKK